jgi:hypothetical protein
MHGTTKEIALSPAVLDESAEYVSALAREDFFAFRRRMRPAMLQNWWTALIAKALQEFYEDLVAGLRPNLVIEAPPQHGKSMTATDFIAWLAGKNPDFKSIYASYSGDLGTRTNLDLQRMMTSPRYREVFDKTRIDQPGWMCNTELIEYVGRIGSFRNTTVEGAINGMELHVGVIDDPIKGRAEAQSKAIRDKVWLWYTDDWCSRFAESAGQLIIMTRWHKDDPLGRFIDRYKGNVKVDGYRDFSHLEITPHGRQALAAALERWEGSAMTMKVEKTSKEELQELIQDLRHRATTACAADPTRWMAVMGVSLVDYLAQLDRLERAVEQIEDEALTHGRSQVYPEG